MGIRRGSSLKENVKAVLTETRFTKRELSEDKLLLLEGPDDIEVIRNYYLYKGKEVTRIFRLIKANEDQTDGVAGKKNALKYYQKLRSENRNVICLLDRDYDFYLDEKNDDPRIKYYDYFELENYLFDDSLFRIILKNVCDYPDVNYYNELVLLLHGIEESCKPFILLCFLREVNYRKDILTEEQLKKVLEIIRFNPMSIMQMTNLNTENVLDRIPTFVNNELQKVGLNIQLVCRLLQDNNYDPRYITDITEPLYLFRYTIKGKTISNSLDYFFKYILEQNPHLKEIKSKGNLSSIIARLKIEWIPSLSERFTELITKIENEYQTLTSQESPHT
ncbi:DUF4435 domain-containing protein [Bacillus sp. ISL-45]|uniref:DUF4435 domain-containing protein n=1 Tax=Bacillus sp. ISL-45 TaxID=2819128 RepID=UPI001BE5222D|nr:DUF4435 domain-containing protein [Bacillus sp. ISL-45]MBT2663612.1 hypothetical protein [Bacillus sp. ISL-45]